MIESGYPLTLEEIEIIWPMISKNEEDRANVLHFIQLVTKTYEEITDIYIKIKNAVEYRRVNLFEYLLEYAVG
jgi:hypothetical protein